MLKPPPTAQEVVTAAAIAAFGRPLVQNNLRAMLVEAMIDAVLPDTWTWASADWAECDFRRSDKVRLEVKQSSARQTWEQKKPYPGSFDIRARTGRWESGNKWVAEPGRNAEVYVFAFNPNFDDSADHRTFAVGLLRRGNVRARRETEHLPGEAQGACVSGRNSSGRRADRGGCQRGHRGPPMHDLIPLDAVLPGALTLAEIDATMAYAEAEQAPSTRLAYAADWRAFAAWTSARGATALPAAPALVAAYLSHLADSGRKAAGIGRAAAAIADRHRHAGYDPSPTVHAGVRAVMKGIRRTIGIAPVKKHAATADIVLRMLAQCGDDLIGRRDRALIAVGLAGAFRRSELVALTTDDIEHTKEGLLITIRRSKGDHLLITIRRSKGDQEGVGQVVSLPHGHHIRPVEALATWLESADITGGVLFRAVALGSRLGEAMSGEAVARVVKKLVERAGLDRKDFAAHSLRSGFLSSAAEHKADVFAMQRQSRHKSLDVLSGYVQSRNLFVGHAGAGFL